MTFPIYGKIKNVPNHQPDEYLSNTYAEEKSGFISMSF
jgi:hypothetical protein